MSILKRIIEEDGNCSWSRKSICDNCPLSKLKKHPNGSWMSCVEALGVQNLSEEEADAKCKDVAARVFLDQTVDIALGEDSGAN